MGCPRNSIGTWARGLAEEAEREEVIRVYLLAPANNEGSIASADTSPRLRPEQAEEGAKNLLRAGAERSRDVFTIPTDDVQQSGVS